MENKYPYLGIHKEFGYVVLFTEEDRGVVVMNDNDKGPVFAAIGDFDENSFDILPKEQCVRLSN